MNDVFAAEADAPDGGLELRSPVDAPLVSSAAAAIDADDQAAFAAVLEPLHPADVADLFEDLDAERRVSAIAVGGAALNPDFLSFLDDGVRDRLLSALPPQITAGLIEQLDSDDAVYALEDLDDAAREDILERLPGADRAVVEQALSYPEDSAGRLMQREFVAAPAHRTVGETIDRMRADAQNLPEIFHDVWVVDPTMRPLGQTPLYTILRTKRPLRIDAIMTERPQTVPVGMDQEEVAHLFRQYGLLEAAVVDESGRMVGVITHDDVVEIIDQEAEEDILKLGGVGGGSGVDGVIATARSRFVWLALNLGTAVLASAVIAVFEDIIAAVVALAVLMPIVASMGGNAGTQSLTVAVRALAMKELRGPEGWRLIWQETAVGLLNGVAFAVVAGALAWAWAGEPMLGAVIGLAMVVNLLVAGLAGAGVPILLQKMKVDPAVASAVFVTTVTDVVGFFVFLGLAALVLL